MTQAIGHGFVSTLEMWVVVYEAQADVPFTAEVFERRQKKVETLQIDQLTDIKNHEACSRFRVVAQSVRRVELTEHFCGNAVWNHMNPCWILLLAKYLASAWESATMASAFLTTN